MATTPTGAATPKAAALEHAREGRALLKQGRLADALARLEAAVAQDATQPDHWNDLGAVQMALNQFDAAGESLKRALQLDPRHAKALANFGQVLQCQDRFEDAALVFVQLYRTCPEAPYAIGQLMFCKLMACDWTAIDTLRARIDAGLRRGEALAEPFGLQAYATDPALLRATVERYAKAMLPSPAASRPRMRPLAGRRLRIGYVSGEFRRQATMMLLAGVLEQHDRTRFEVIGLDNGRDDGSAMRQRVLAALDRHVPIAGLGDADAAAQVRALEVDILVNLNGYFGAERNGLFAQRPAPVQVNYLGFPGTLGQAAIDYLVADPFVVPDAHRAHYTEAVVRLPQCYQPNDDRRAVDAAPIVRAELGLPEGAFVYCSFNNSYKLLPETFDAWLQLLRRVPQAVLWLYAPVPEVQANLRERAVAAGLDAARLVFAPHWAASERHLARLACADLMLDTWPYNAHTTGADALRAGLPLLTLVGTTFPGRVGQSLLNAVGLPELVTHRLPDYLALAERLAREPAQLAALRQRLAQAWPKAALFDTTRYTRYLEQAYLGMAERAAGDLPAEGFDVDPHVQGVGAPG